MRCPIDQNELVMSDRQGIEIDYCPTCRGVWLDRGELDKLVERSAAYESGARGRYDDERSRDERSRDRDRFDDRRRYDDDDDDHRRWSGGSSSERMLGEVKDLVGRRNQGSHDAHSGHDSHGRPRRKKKSFLEDILDF